MASRRETSLLAVVKSAPQPSLKGRALRALAARELTTAELRAKLAPHVPADAAPGALDRLLAELQAKGFLSDARATEAWIARRAPKLGRQRVLSELRERGVAADALSEVSAQLLSSELERAQDVWTKKFGVPPSSAEERLKQMRFLAGRGFEFGVIHQIVKAERP